MLGGTHLENDLKKYREEHNDEENKTNIHSNYYSGYLITTTAMNLCNLQQCIRP